jgi:hypothetical protein
MLKLITIRSTTIDAFPASVAHPAGDETGDIALVEVPKEAYPQAVEKAQPWKIWMKLVEDDHLGNWESLAITPETCDGDIGSLGGY